MKTKLIILGCGSSVGVPRIDGVWGKSNKKNKKNFRTRCSALLVRGSNNILIDTSPDIRFQFLKNKIKSISSVLLTHEHADQTNGLFELRPFYWKSKKRINIYANRKTIKHLKTTFGWLFKKKINYPAIIKSNLVKKKFSLGVKDEKISFETVEAKHGPTQSVVYLFEKAAYISDSNDLSIIKNTKFKKLNFLIIDCLKMQKHPSHFNLEDVLDIQKKISPKKTILTNLHHDLDYDYLLKILPKEVIPAYDGLRITL